MGTGEFNARVTLRWTSIPFKECRNTPFVAACVTESGDKCLYGGPYMQTLHIILYFHQSQQVNHQSFLCGGMHVEPEECLKYVVQ